MVSLQAGASATWPGGGGGRPRTGEGSDPHVGKRAGLRTHLKQDFGTEISAPFG